MAAKGSRGHTEHGARPGGAGDGRQAVREYIRSELEKIDAEGLAPTKKAKKRRAFLADQLKIASGEDPRRVKLDAALVRAARLRAEADGMRQAPGAGASRGEAGRVPGNGRWPPYWAGCESMGFDELRGFVEEALRRRSDRERDREGDPNDEGSPRSKEEFMHLVGLLRRKMDEWRPPAVPPDPGQSPSGAFKPSTRLRAMREENERLAATIREMVKDLDVGWERIGELRREMGRHIGEIRAAEAAERGRYPGNAGERRRAHEDAAAARKAALRAFRRSKKAHDETRPRRALVCARIRHDVERAFAESPVVLPTTPPAGRLPWRPLPPGELTREGVRAHYRRLASEHPELRYEPERIEKALSLGPSQWWEGLDDFGGYVVFEYPGTGRVLVECAVYGNAIYVLGSDWKRLSKLSKRELLTDHTLGVTKIVHRGDWFARVKAALGVRRRRA